MGQWPSKQNTGFSEEREPLLLDSAEDRQLPAQCVDDPMASYTLEAHGAEAFPMLYQPPVFEPDGATHSEEREALLSISADQEQLPLQCVDNPTGLNAVVAIEAHTFSMPNPPPVLIQAEGAGEFKI